MIIKTWRNIFFFEGLFTVLVGLAAPFVMPTSPGECFFLNERERRIAHERLISKTGAGENQKVAPRHVKRAVLNITNYICAFGFFFINITVQGISLFMVRMKTLRYSRSNTDPCLADDSERSWLDCHQGSALLRSPLRMRLSCSDRHRFRQ